MDKQFFLPSLFRRRPTKATRSPFVALAIIAIAAASHATLAEVLSNSQILFSNSSSTDYAATVYQTAAGNPTAIILNYTGTTLDVTGVTADEGSDWYFVNSGETFTGNNIAQNQFPVLFTTTTDPPILSIPLGDFYLGVTTGVGFTNGQANRNVFGWLELNNTGTELLPVANAADYGDGGIVVGTTTAAPEPASLPLLALAALPLLRRRRPHIQ